MHRITGTKRAIDLAIKSFCFAKLSFLTDASPAGFLRAPPPHQSVANSLQSAAQSRLPLALALALWEDVEVQEKPLLTPQGASPLLLLAFGTSRCWRKWSCTCLTRPKVARQRRRVRSDGINYRTSRQKRFPFQFTHSSVPSGGKQRSLCQHTHAHLKAAGWRERFI